MFTIKYTKESINQLKKIQNAKLIQKISLIISNIATDPYSKDYKFERLKHNLTGYCSKRLDQKNRIIYKVQDNQIIVTVISVLGHYEEN